MFNKPAVFEAPLVTPRGYSRDMAHSTFSITLDQFFSPVLPNGSYTISPQIRYDRLSKRWFITAIEVNASIGKHLVLLAISDADKISDASGFTYYSFDPLVFPFNHNGPYTPFIDVALLGVDKHSVLVGGALVGYDSVLFVGYVINKEKLMKGNLVVYPFQLGNVNRKAGSITGVVLPQGVYNDDPAAVKSFFVGRNGAHDALVLANIAYDKNNKPSLESETTLPVEPFNVPRVTSAPGGTYDNCLIRPFKHPFV